MECRLTKKAERHFNSGEYAEALEDYFKILSDQKNSFGINHEETLRTRIKIALIYENTGQLEKALEELQIICKKYESKSHRSQLTISHLKVKYRLANVLEKLGDERKAMGMKAHIEETLKYQARAFEKHSKGENALNYFRSVKRYEDCAASILGPYHETTLRMGEVIGDMHSLKGDYDVAHKMYSKLLSLKMSFAERKECLPLWTKVASMEEKQWNYADALKSYESISKVYESWQPADCISACKIDMCILKMSQNLGNPSRAEEAFSSVKLRLKAYADLFVDLRHKLSSELYSEICKERCREIVEKQYNLARKGFDYMQSVLTLSNEDTLRLGWVVGFMCRLMEKYKDSLQIYEQVYETSLSYLGANHSLTINSCLDRVSLLRYLCNLREAFAVLNDFFHKRNAFLGITQQMYDDVALKIRYESANIFYQEGTYAPALDIYDSVSKVWNADDETKLDGRRMLMKASYEVGHHEKVVAIIKEFYDESPDLDRLNVEHLERKGVVRFLCDLAEIYEQHGEYDNAVTIYESMNGICRAKGINSPLHIETKLAIIRAKQNEGEDYVEKFEELIKKCEEISNPGHSLTSSIRKGLAMAYFRRNHIQRACSVYAKLVAENEQILGYYHSDTLEVKYLGALSVLESALPYPLLMVKEMFEEILQVQSAVHYPFHPDRLAADYNIGVTNEKMGYINEAFQIYCDIYTEIEFFYSACNPYLPNIKNRIDSIANRIKEPNLIIATDGANLKEVKFCLNNGDDVNARGNNGFTSLHLASRRGYTDILKCLLQHGASYKIKNWEWKSPVDIACDDETTRIFHLADELFHCIKDNDFENVERIIRLENALVNVKDENGFSPLHCACYEGCHSIVQFLLENGADVKLRAFRGYLVFHLAAIKGDNDMILLLIKHIEINIPEDFAEMFNDNDNDQGATPLHLAAQRNRVHTVHLLGGHDEYRQKRDKLGKLPIDLAAGSEVKDFLKSWKK